MQLGHRAIQTAVIISIFSTLGSIFVLLRLWTRFVIVRAPGWEDAVLVVSWLCAVVTVVTIGLQVHFGLGEHGANLSAYQGTQLLLMIYISISTYCASIGLTKIAILMQYQRVFRTPRFQIWCKTFIAIIVAYTIATVVACLFVCTPPVKFWKPQTPGYCINTIASWFSNAAINIVTDFMIVILPMPVVNRLQLKKKQKWLLMGVFAFGAIVCVISIVRLHSLLIITTSKDQSYDNAGVATFSIVEINVAIIGACLPTLRPLLARVSNSFHTSRGTGSGSNNQKRSSVMPAIGGSYGVPLSNLHSKKHGMEKLDGESDADIQDRERIRVITMVDVKVSGKEGTSVQDERESSTESLFRNAGRDGHIV